MNPAVLEGCVLSARRRRHGAAADYRPANDSANPGRFAIGAAAGWSAMRNIGSAATRSLSVVSAR
ncbi:hypothetical protein DMH17_11410 [Raoultella planticola]|nr:hypothetical protein [Raoultella planticola]